MLKAYRCSPVTTQTHTYQMLPKVQTVKRKISHCDNSSRPHVQLGYIMNPRPTNNFWISGLSRSNLSPSSLCVCRHSNQRSVQSWIQLNKDNRLPKEKPFIASQQLLCDFKIRSKQVTKFRPVFRHKKYGQNHFEKSYIFHDRYHHHSDKTVPDCIRFSKTNFFRKQRPKEGI